MAQQSRKKKVTNARDVHLKTVHLSVFTFGKKTKFLCDHRNNGNRQIKESKNLQTTRATMAQTAARKSHYLKVVSSSLTGRSSRRIILFAVYPTKKI